MLPKKTVTAAKLQDDFAEFRSTVVTNRRIYLVLGDNTILLIESRHSQKKLGYSLPKPLILCQEDFEKCIHDLFIGAWKQARWEWSGDS